MDGREHIMNIIVPVLEYGVWFAAKYCKACNRSVVTATDMEYGLKFSAMHMFNESYGSVLDHEDLCEEEKELENIVERMEAMDENDPERLRLQEIAESMEERLNADCVVEDEFGHEFTEYAGNDEAYLDVNKAVRDWDSWEPEDPLQVIMKHAVNSKINN